MKRLFLMLIAALTATVLVAGTGTAGDTRGKKCADIVFGQGDGYVTRDPAGDPTGTPLANPRLQWQVVFAEPNCSELTTLYVYDDSDTETSTLVTLTSTETGTTSITFTYTFNQTGGATAPEDENICVVATTLQAKHVADRAPDAGCLTLSGLGSPSSAFN
jgi:hypothetical protein